MFSIPVLISLSSDFMMISSGGFSSLCVRSTLAVLVVIIKRETVVKNHMFMSEDSLGIQMGL